MIGNGVNWDLMLLEYDGKKNEFFREMKIMVMFIMNEKKGLKLVDKGSKWK